MTDEFRALIQKIEHGEPGDGLQPRDRAWIMACREIIDRCVAPSMYANALAMLERATTEAKRTFP